MRTVAALFIDPRGPYPFIHGVESWGLPWRDARTYHGPHPVVAHPPCGPWSRLRHLCERDHDAECGPRAFEQVRAFGGVLEHPAGSKLFEHVGAPRPGDKADHFGGRTYLVRQVDWGHCCTKATWLYVVGIDESRVLRDIAERPHRAPTHWASGGRTESSRRGTPVPPGIKVASAQQRRRTPACFAHWLVSLARVSAP